MKFLPSLALLLAVLGTAVQAHCPTRAIAIVVPSGAGGVADITVRTVGEAMSKSLKQLGAGSIVGSAVVERGVIVAARIPQQ